MHQPRAAHWQAASHLAVTPQRLLVLKPRRTTCGCTHSSKQDLYAVLGVAYDADMATIKSAFRRQAKMLHPDVNPDPGADAAFRLLKRAHEVLSDRMLRAAYDTELQERAPEAAAVLRARDPRFAR